METKGQELERALLALYAAHAAVRRAQVGRMHSDDPAGADAVWTEANAEMRRCVARVAELRREDEQELAREKAWSAFTRRAAGLERKP